MMLRLEALRSCALPLLLNAADRLMSGKKRSDVDSDQRILCLHLSSAAASVQSGDGRLATPNRMQRLSCGTRAESLRLRPRSIRVDCIALTHGMLAGGFDDLPLGEDKFKDRPL